MIDYLIEIVFKDMSVKNAVSSLLFFSKNEMNIKSFHTNLDVRNDLLNDEELLKKILKENKDFNISFNLNYLSIDAAKLKNCQIVFYRFEKTIDVEINFQLLEVESCEDNLLVKNLMSFAKDFANHYEIEDYYCGIEPAGDLENRLFTKEEAGPIIF